MQSLQEIPYTQYFVGLHEFHPEPLFDSSMMVHFRKRFPVEEMAKINEYICTGKWPEQQKNVDRNDNREDNHDENDPRPSLTSDILTDIDLLNKSREHLETAVSIL